MLIQGKQFTIGADPEVFLQQNGNFVSAHDLLPGTKAEPFIVPQGAVQVDGMAAEFNIDPANNLEEFLSNLNSVQDTLKGMIGDKTFLEQVSVSFDEDFVKNIPSKSLELGCEADYNGYTLEDNVAPEAAQLMRTAGGHTHIGGFHTDSPFESGHFKTSARLARILDYTLGVYSILWDKDDQRRAMYGQAGCFRPKKYGMEYRTLSNKWIFSENLVGFVYDQVKEALELMFDPDFEPPEGIQEIINSSDRGSSFFVNNPTAERLLA